MFNHPHKRTTRSDIVSKKHITQLLGVICFTAAMAILSIVHIWSKHLNGPPIRSDGFGYYAYLPSVFIDHDLSLSTARQHLPFGQLQDYGIAFQPRTGRYIDKYPPGTAILQTPSFLIAHVLSAPLGFTQDGYSLPYQIANTSSAILYLSIGIFFIYCACRRASGHGVSLATCILLVFATNVFHYATYDASFSHIYEFSLISLCVWLATLYLSADAAGKNWLCIALGLCVGLIAITRLTNAIVLLLPIALIAKDWREKRNNRALLVHLCIVGSIFVLTIFPEIWYIRHATGIWQMNSYAAANEPGSFNWLHPEISNFLWSVRKGAFFWCPLLLISLVGMPYAMQRMPWLATASACILALDIYICASWYCWSFGGSFGSRPMVDIAPLLAIPLAMTVKQLLEKDKHAYLLVGASTLIVINLTLMHAYWHRYIPFDGANWEVLRSLPEQLSTTL